MALNHNNKEIRKVKHNGKYVEKLNYNGTEVTFGSYNKNALETFAEKPTISASINNAEAVVNLYNGCMKLMIPDISFGNAALGIGVSHIYNTLMDNDEIYKAKWTFMGYGMKINYQQYLIKVNNDLYYYIDGTGSRHEIVPATGGITLYDTSGLGLILTIDDFNSEYILTDRDNNRLFFNQTTGFITRMENNLSHLTLIEYDNYRIIKITKKVNDESCIMFFNYDELDRLSTIKYNDADLYIEYTYEGETNLLKSITKKALSEVELLVNLEYDGDKKIKYIYNSLDQAIRILYSTSLVAKINEGIYESKVFETLKAYTITYNKNNNTMVTMRLNDNNYGIDTKTQVRIVYSYNYNGSLMSSYEVIDDKNYVSLIPSSSNGTRLLKKVLKTEKSFNGVEIINIKDTNITSIDKQLNISDNNNVSTIIQAMNGFYKTYTFSFWYRFKNAINPNEGSNSYKIVGKFNSTEKIEKSIIYDSNWHYISCDKEFNNKITNIEFFFLAAGTINNIDIDITDFRASSKTSIIKLQNSNSNTDIKQIKNFELNKTTTKQLIDLQDIVNDNQYYLTPKDIIWSQENKLLNNKIIYFNNGKKAMVIDSTLVFKSSEQNFELTLPTFNTPFLYHEIVKDEQVKIKSFICFEKNNTDATLKNKYEMVISYKNNNEISWARRKYNNKNQLIEEIDEYKIQKFYYYNTFGNLTRKTTQYIEIAIKDGNYDEYMLSDNTKKIIEKNTYDKKGNIDIKTDSTGSEIDYTVDSIYGNVQSIIDANKTMKIEYKYKSLQDNLETINQYTGASLNNLYNNLTFGYENGLLTSITRKDSKKYTFGYDSYGNLNSYKINGNIIQTLSTVYSDDSVIKKNKFHNSKVDVENIWNSDKFDIYGRLISKVDDSKGTYLTNVYEDYNGLASSAALLRISEDKYADTIFDYSYDINEDLFKYTCKTIGTTSGYIFNVEAKSTKEGKPYVLYNGEASTVSYLIEYDDNKNIMPRIKSITIGSINKQNYNYDNLGRLDNIAYFYNTTNLSNVKIIYDTYNSSPTYQIKEIRNSFGGTTNSRSYEYDKNKNVKVITQKYNNEIDDYQGFNYNECNNLIYVDSYYENYTVNYDKFGNRELFLDNATMSGLYRNHVYKYKTSDKDVLVQIEGANYSFDYDNIGNQILHKKHYIHWERGNLLKEYPCSSTKTCYFKYNAYGVRIQKKIQEVGISTYHNIVIDGTKIIGEIIKKDKSSDIQVTYSYDLNGIFGMNVASPGLATISYYFEKDKFGSIVGIYRMEVNRFIIVTSYLYDAWGNFTEYYERADETDKKYIKYNPFKWKGYYYDLETGLYYLNGRYYDPEIGRFINSNYNGNYMESDYVLPENNPLAFPPNNQNCFPRLSLVPHDEQKNSIFDSIYKFFNRIMIIPMQAQTVVWVAVTSILTGRGGDLWDDLTHGRLNPFNKSEKAALDSKVLSFYKGSVVVKQSFYKIDSRITSFGIFGTIFLEDTYYYNSKIPEAGIWAIKHEWGHTEQERMMGTFKFFINIAIPSLTHRSNNDYYSNPWEYSADVLGGVDRGDYLPGSHEPGMQYLKDNIYWW